MKVLYQHLSVVMKDPMVRRLLSPSEAEMGLRMVVERIVDRVLEREQRLGRNLAFNEFYKCIMEVLDEFTPEPEYII